MNGRLMSSANLRPGMLWCVAYACAPWPGTTCWEVLVMFNGVCQLRTSLLHVSGQYSHLWPQGLAMMMPTATKTDSEFSRQTRACKLQTSWSAGPEAQSDIAAPAGMSKSQPVLGHGWPVGSREGSCIDFSAPGRCSVRFPEADPGGQALDRLWCRLSLLTS